MTADQARLAVPLLAGRRAELLLSVYQHRMLSTSQVHRLHAPDVGIRSIQAMLTKLRKAGLIDGVAVPRSETLWFVTAKGAGLAELADVRARAYRVTPAAAAGPLLAHTEAVNDVGIAFVEAARRLGHECGPLDWEHEIAHPWRDVGQARRGGTDHLVIADAVLRYTVLDDDEDALLTRWVELDRATQSVARLEHKIRCYAAMHDYRPPGARQPGWRSQYVEWPRLLVVLAGRPEPALQRRRELLTAACTTNPDIAPRLEQLAASVTTLGELTRRGPFAPIWHPLTGGPPVTVTGERHQPGLLDRYAPAI